HRLLLARRYPAVGLPARRRDPIGEGADHHEHQVDHTHGNKRLPDTDGGRRLEVVDEQISQWRADHRAATKTHERHAGSHTPTIRDPYDQRTHRRDVAEAKPDAADHAGAEPHQPELMDV